MSKLSDGGNIWVLGLKDGDEKRVKLKMQKK